MPKKKFEDERTQKVYDELKQTGYIVSPKQVFDVHRIDGMSIASVFPDDSYIQFHDEYTQLGCDIPVFKRLMTDFGFESNHI